MEFLELKLKPEKKFSEFSNKLKIIPGKKYQTKTRVAKILGLSYSGYFGVIIFNKADMEIARRICWLNHSSKNKKTIKIIFLAPKNSEYLRIVYRINDEVPVRSFCKYKLIPIDRCTLSEVDLKVRENFSLLENYQIPSSIILPRPKELSENDEKILEKNIVWIFASPRSGTQWLGTKLLTFRTNVSQGPSIGLSLGSIHHETGFGDKIIRQFEFRGHESDYFLSNQYKRTWQHYIRKLILNRLYAQFWDLSKKIIIPDPEGSMAADIISECLPNSKIIILLRDGRDVLDSLVDLLQPNTWYTKDGKSNPIYPETRLNRIEWLIKKWIMLIEILLKTYECHPKKNCIKIKYEDLRTNTPEILQKIYNFIGIKVPKKQLKHLVDYYSFENIPEEKKGTGKVTRTATPGKWKENFNDKEKKLLNEMMKKTLRKLGYK